MTERTGQCLCGAVRYRLRADPVFTRICWCRACQHLASNGTVNVLVPADSVEYSGELRDYACKAESGNEIRRRFCPTCGSHVFATSSGRPQFMVVRVGTLDDPGSVKPTTNIWAENAPTWACLDASLERVDRQPGAPAPSRPG